VSLYGRIFAAGYDRAFDAVERAGLSDMRARLLTGARGRTLELGAGTGLNLRHYPGDGITLVLTEPEEPMARRLERRVHDVRSGASVVRASADCLPFGDGSIDTVVSTLVLCTVPDQRAALREIRRVLSAEGTMLFLEHVRSDDPRVTRRQDRLQPLWVRVGHGCHCNRDTLAAIRRAGFDIEAVEHGHLPNAPAFIRPLIIGRARTELTRPAP
jgi:ubiquinone/menaquinone biosynthesis C-methylase UbiE